MVAKGRSGEGGRGKDRAAHDPPPPSHSANIRRREGYPFRDQKDGTEQDPEEANEGGGGDKQTPQGAPFEVTCGGEDATPQRKIRTSQDSPLNVRTSCFRESIETSCITATGCAWTGELQTTLHGSINGGGSLRNQRAGTPRPQDR